MIQLDRFRRASMASLVGLAVLAIAGACAGPKVEVYERPDGTVIVESLEVVAKVEAVDARTRTITLKRRFHEAKTFKADDDLPGFDQIQVGDEVHAVVVEETAVVLVPGGAPSLVAEAAGIAVGPEGSKPRVVMVDTVEMTAEIIGIDAHTHQVTLELPDGSVDTVKAAKHIDLTKLALGDSVLIRVTEAVAIAVVKPS